MERRTALKALVSAAAALPLLRVQLGAQEIGAGDRVWFDSDADGVQDAGETGISGVKMTLTADFNGDGSPDYTATTTTGANGIYGITGLPAATYTVTVDPTTLPANYTETYDLDGLATLNNATGDLAAGENRVDFDFGYVATAPGFSLVKTANKTIVAPGESVTYSYVVTNTGATALTSVVLVDDNGTPGDPLDDFLLTSPTGDSVNPGVLDPGEVWTYQATVTPPLQLTASNVNGYTGPAGTLTSQVLANGDIRITYRQSTNVNNNTYGTGSDPGWMAAIGKAHTFGDLTGSDKAGFELKNASGQVAMKFYMDYITASNTQEQINGTTSSRKKRSRRSFCQRRWARSEPASSGSGKPLRASSRSSGSRSARAGTGSAAPGSRAAGSRPSRRSSA